MKVTFHKLDLFRKMFETVSTDFFEQFHKSLAPKYNRDQVFKAGEGSGRSGSFFFFSHDRKFIIKTMNSKERKLLLDNLQAFNTHFLKHPDSLLARIYGVFTIKTSQIKEVSVLLMENTLQLENPLALRCIFDLKGSFVNR